VPARSNMVALVRGVVCPWLRIGILLMSRGCGARCPRVRCAETPSPTPIALPTTVEDRLRSWRCSCGLRRAVALLSVDDRGQTGNNRTLRFWSAWGWPEISFVDATERLVLDQRLTGNPMLMDRHGDLEPPSTEARRAEARHYGHRACQCKTSLSFVDAQHGFLAAGDENRQRASTEHLMAAHVEGNHLARSIGLRHPSGRLHSSSRVSPANLGRSGCARLGMNSTTHQFDGYVSGPRTAAPAGMCGEDSAPTTSIAIVTASSGLQLVEPDQSSETTDSAARARVPDRLLASGAGCAPDNFRRSAYRLRDCACSISADTDGGLTGDDQNAGDLAPG